MARMIDDKHQETAEQEDGFLLEVFSCESSQCWRGRSGCTPTDLGVQGCKGQRF